MRHVLAAALLAAAIVGGFLAFGDRRTPIAADELGAYGFHPGELVEDFHFRDVQGRRAGLSKLLEGHTAVVVALRTVECPVGKRYGHRLARMEQEFRERGVAFVFLDVSSQDSEEDIRNDLDTFGFTGHYISDPDGEIGDLIQAKVSTEVFVIDRARTIRYRGAIDDQFGITFSNPVVRNHWLRDALEAVLDGRDVDVPETEASGCYLESSSDVVSQRDLTYHSRVSRIVQNNCVTCHRDGGIAPFALDSFDQLYGFREMVKWVVQEERMPPWFADPDHGDFKNDRRLSERDKRDLIAWIEAGAPEGDPKYAPLPRKFAGGWQLPAEPDAVIELPEPQEVPPEGVLDYRYVYVKTDFDEDKWIVAAEALPTATAQTHHIIGYLEEPGAERRGDWIVAWAPGTPAMEYPEGSAKLLPKGATIMFELHYTPNGTPTTDMSKLGFVFADDPTELREVETTFVGTSKFEIPPHAPDHEVVAVKTLRRGGQLLTLFPHMHLRGKAFRIEHVPADGEARILLDVPRYDFNWQLAYELAEPLRLEAGDQLRATAWYDNSDGNPANPDPSVPVSYGEQSFEEMMFGFYDWIPDPREPRRATDDAERD